MDLEFSKEDLAFREEVRAFLKENLPDRLKDGARRTPGVFVEPDIGLEWHRILNDKGWVAYHWPKEDGGTGDDKRTHKTKCIVRFHHNNFADDRNGDCRK